MDIPEGGQARGSSQIEVRSGLGRKISSIININVISTSSAHRCRIFCDSKLTAFNIRGQGCFRTFYNSRPLLQQEDFWLDVNNPDHTGWPYPGLQQAIKSQWMAG